MAQFSVEIRHLPGSVLGGNQHRYGKFSERSLDFGEARSGKPDFHLIYGPNEAGKSTTLSAFLDLLYGIEPRSPFNFLHPYPTMRIGAELDLSAGRRGVVRIKRPQNSLFDDKDQPLGDGILLADLGGIDRIAYRSMFVLDDATIESGGESILRSEGDLGQLLFSASSGLAELSGQLALIKVDADKFYKFKARSGALADLKAQLAILKAERDELDTLASEYAALIATRDRAGLAYDEAIAARGRAQSRIEEIQRFLNALPRLAVLRQLRERMEPLADIPNAPGSWTALQPHLQEDDVALSVREQGIAEEIDALKAQHDAIDVDETILAATSRVEALTALEARFVTAQDDIPNRQLQLKESEATIANVVKALGRAEERNPTALLLNAATVGQLRDLVEQQSGLDIALRTARAEVTSAEELLADAEKNRAAATAGDVVLSATDIATLSATVAALRSNDHAAHDRAARRALAEVEALLTARLEQLQPWVGDADALLKMNVPAPDDLHRWKTELSETEKQISHYRADLERLASLIGHLEAERAALSAGVGVVSDTDAGAVRTERERAWAHHRQTLTQETAETFEATLRKDDLIAASRLAHTAEVAKLHKTVETLAVSTSDRDRAQDLLDQALQRQSKLEDTVIATLGTMAPLLSSISVAQLEVWLTRRTSALEARQNVQQKKREVVGTENDLKAAASTLQRAFEKAALPLSKEASFDGLLIEAEVAIEKQRAGAALASTIDQKHDALARRKAALLAAERDMQTFESVWQELCARSWLGPDATLATVKETLVVLTDLGPALERRDSLADRIDKMRDDQESFRREIVSLAETVGLPLDAADRKSNDLLELSQAIADRWRSASSAREKKHAAVTALATANERQRALSEQRQIHNAQKGAMTTHFGVVTLHEVAGKLSDLEKRADC